MKLLRVREIVTRSVNEGFTAAFSLAYASGCFGAPNGAA